MQPTTTVRKILYSSGLGESQNRVRDGWEGEPPPPVAPFPSDAGGWNTACPVLSKQCIPVSAIKLKKNTFVEIKAESKFFV